MRKPVILLAIATAASLLVALVTGAMAKSAAEDAGSLFGGIDAESVSRAASLAAFSNVALTWTGVGAIGLLVVWAIKGALDTQVLHINGDLMTRS